MFTKAQEIASQYQSPGAAGIGFAQYASTGTVTPELWDNIERTERDARNGVPGTDGWIADMAELRKLLREAGHRKPVAGTFFQNYRADELADVEAVGDTYRLKVTGDNGSESKTAYKAAVDAKNRIDLPDLSD
jgi:hypothetical protein